MVQASTLECLYLYDQKNLKLTTQILTQPNGSVSEATLKQIQKQLELDEINFKYLQVLLGAYGESKKPRQNDITIVIADRENLAEARGNPSMVIPTAIAGDLMKIVPVTDYSMILANQTRYQAEAPNVRFWVKKLMAGTGSGITRVEFLNDIYRKLGRTEAIKIGAKGTDLFAHVEIDGVSHILSIAELQILQLLAQSDKYKQIIFHDVVSNETDLSIQRTWTKPSSLLKGKSLLSVALKKGEVRAEPTIQYHIPTINEAGYLTMERTAPGGHALFAIDAVISVLKKRLPKVGKNETLVGVIGNGEDLMSTPSPEIVGWIAKENLPIVMVTTEKTDLDKQGGQIAIGFNSGGQEYVTMVEKAQADAAVKKGYSNQSDLFAKLGLRERDAKAMFNTNMAIVNYNALEPRLLALANKVGGNEKLLELIAPDLIANSKKQKDSNGTERTFVQLEGAMGSVILKLDRLHREVFNGQPLVHFLNISKMHRTQFFSPIKTAFDFFMQFYSDRFIVDGNKFTIVNQRPGFIPKVSLADNFYKEAANVLKAFKGTRILELDELSIEGIVNPDKSTNGTVLLPGMKLSGIVRINNLSGQAVDLSSALNSKELKNVEILINADGTIRTTKIGN